MNKRAASRGISGLEGQVSAAANTLVGSCPARFRAVRINQRNNRWQNEKERKMDSIRNQVIT